jgi:hypothetical protein
MIVRKKPSPITVGIDGAPSGEQTLLQETADAMK